MKIDQKIKTFLALCFLLTAASLNSCKKLIQIPPNAPNQIVTAQVFADSSDAVAAVSVLYAVLNNQTLAVPSGGLTVYPGLSADELQYVAGNTLQYQCYINAIAASSTVLWQPFYFSVNGGIYTANACIEGLNASKTISSSLRNQLIGECEVIRAFHYFYLVNLFGGVPLVTTTNYTVNESLPRATPAAVYAQIIADLTDAIQKRLTVAYPSAGHARINLYVASALLAKVYLYQSKWSDAITQATSVINSGLYSLELNLNNVFLDGSSEAIWQIPPIGTVPNAPTPEGIAFVPISTRLKPHYFINSYLLNAFESGDQRFANWVNYNTVGGTKYYYPYKYKNNLSTSNATEEDYMIFRLAEQYLIRAEAEAENSDPVDAVSDLNIIRARAGLSPASVTASSPNTDILSAIMHERQVELFCEWGNRWLDLKRTGTVQSVLATEKGGPWLQDIHAALYPIPISVIQSDPNITQNPGY